MVSRAVECPVCKDVFAEGEEVRKMPCEHSFHPPCITTWLKQVSRWRIHSAGVG